MINQELSKKILTIGCSYIPPKGGMSQVIYNYSKYVFPTFNCIVNSGIGNKIYKLKKIVYATFKIIYILLLNKSIKIVHIHTSAYNSFKRATWFLYIAKLFNKKIVLHIHSGNFKKYYYTNPKKISTILNKCNSIITLSEYWQKFFQQISNCKSINIVENVIPLPQISHITKDSKFHLLYLGLITQQKGIYDLIDTIAENKHYFKGKLILHIGGKGEVEQLNTLIHNYNISDIVKFEGWVSGNEKAKLFNMADAFILPSYAEGLPVSILEAMSYGLPILSTPVGGIPEIVTSQIGILFQPGDKQSIYNSIMTIMNNNLTTYKKNISSTINFYFPDQVSLKLENLYASLLR